jgi:phosphoribosylformylglycinamidine (FGAM) synthase PurS component
MPHRIEVKSKIPDGRAETRQRKLRSAGFAVSSVEIVDVYTIDADLTLEQLQEAADSLVNPVFETATIDKPNPSLHFEGGS